MGAVVASLALAVGWSIVLPATSAGADPAPLTSSTTFTESGTVEVPACATSVTVDLVGGHGGRGGDTTTLGSPGAGGAGARLTADLAGAAGATLSVVVGHDGQDGHAGSDGLATVAGAGGSGWRTGGGAFNGTTDNLFGQFPGASGGGGGGGGASAVLITGQPILVAGGGGGGAGSAMRFEQGDEVPAPYAAPGGAAGQDGPPVNGIDVGGNAGVTADGNGEGPHFGQIVPIVAADGDAGIGVGVGGPGGGGGGVRGGGVGTSAVGVATSASASGGGGGGTSAGFTVGAVAAAIGSGEPTGLGAARARVSWTCVDPQVAWAAPAPIVYGTALGSTQLSATAAVPGTFTYDPPAGTILPAGPHTLSVHFTPTDPAASAAVDAQVDLQVQPAVLTVQAPSLTRAAGTPNPELVPTLEGFVAGDTATTAAITGTPSCTTDAMTASPPGDYDIPCVPGTLSAPSYTFVGSTGTLTVEAIPSRLVVAPILLRLRSPWISVTVGSVSARLTSDSGTPIAGQAVRFTSRGTAVCTATTDAAGVATCHPALLRWVQLLVLGRLDATYAGNGMFLPSVGTSHLVG